MALISMQTMRYINLLDKTSRVKTSKCFVYNNVIIFAVPKALVSRAIGPNGEHARKIQQILGKKVRVIEEPHGLENAEKFVKDIVEPVDFKSLEIQNDEFVLTAGSQSKAALIGRNKVRLQELGQILEDNFGKTLRIV